MLATIAPETGDPTRRPNPVIKKDWPMRVPNLRISGVSVMSATGEIDTNPPVKKPYSRAKAMVPPKFDIPIQQRARMPDIIVAGISTLSGPTLSVRKFGITLPATDAEFRIGSR